jgi:hypothetical protein
MSRLIRTGLVAATRKDCPNRCCGRTHISYSLTLAGRATYAAAELGLSLNQLCYRTYARAVRCRSIINGEQEFSEKDVHPVFSMLFPANSPAVTRKEPAKKGFLVNHAWHISATAALSRIVQLFSTSELHRTVVTVYIQAAGRPCEGWSIGNLPGVQSSGIVDGRTYAAWQQAVHQGVLHTCL